MKTDVPTNTCKLLLRLQLHGAIYRPNSFVLMLRYCANLKAIRYESASLNRIVLSIASCNCSSRTRKQPIKWVQDGAICKPKFVQRGTYSLFSFSNGEHEKKRVRQQQRNFDGLHPKQEA